MALNYNKVIVCGNICGDLELKSTQSGLSVVSFSIAVNTYSKSSRNSAIFVNVQAWKEKAEFITQYFRKGMPIFIEGRLNTQKWQDKNGMNRSSMIVVADSANFVDSKSQNDAAASENYTPPVSPVINDFNLEEISVDELPF